MYNKFPIKVDGEEITVYRVENDINGNPRYVVHYLDLGLKKYESNDLTRSLDLKKYRGKWFGGGFVLSSYSLEDTLHYIVKKIKDQKEIIKQVK